MLSLTGEKVGKISKQWSGFAREIFTDADFFGINFPMDLDVRMKAVLLGATFLIVSLRTIAKYCWHCINCFVFPLGCHVLRKGSESRNRWSGHVVSGTVAVLFYCICAT